MRRCLSTLPISGEEAVRRARNWQNMAGSDYVKDVTCAEPFVWRPDDAANHNKAYVPVGTSFGSVQAPARHFKVAAFDYGAKYSIFRKLVRHGFEVLVFPCGGQRESRYAEHRPDAVFLSNGPGDPGGVAIHLTRRQLKSCPSIPSLASFLDTK